MATSTKIEYGETDVFQKDLKRLLKKFRTLEEDLETAKRNAIELYHLKRIDNRSVFPIPDFCTEEVQICKIKKFACKALKGWGVMSGIRVIYAFHVATFKVKFLEIYFKPHPPSKLKPRRPKKRSRVSSRREKGRGLGKMNARLALASDGDFFGGLIF